MATPNMNAASGVDADATSIRVSIRTFTTRSTAMEKIEPILWMAHQAEKDAPAIQAAIRALDPDLLLVLDQPTKDEVLDILRWAAPELYDDVYNSPLLAKKVNPAIPKTIEAPARNHPLQFTIDLLNHFKQRFNNDDSEGRFFTTAIEQSLSVVRRLIQEDREAIGRNEQSPRHAFMTAELTRLNERLAASGVQGIPLEAALFNQLTNILLEAMRRGI